MSSCVRRVRWTWILRGQLANPSTSTCKSPCWNASTVPEIVTIIFGNRRGIGSHPECLGHARTCSRACAGASWMTWDRETVKASKSGTTSSSLHAMVSLAQGPRIIGGEGWRMSSKGVIYKEHVRYKWWDTKCRRMLKMSPNRWYSCSSKLTERRCIFGSKLTTYEDNLERRRNPLYTLTLATMSYTPEGIVCRGKMRR